MLNEEKTITISLDEYNRLLESQKQVDELKEERENMQAEIIATEEARLQAVKDTAKEIYSAVLEFCPVHNDGSYSKFISLFEEWLKHKYGVEVE